MSSDHANYQKLLAELEDIVTQTESEVNDLRTTGSSKAELDYNTSKLHVSTQFSYNIATRVQCV